MSAYRCRGCKTPPLDVLAPYDTSKHANVCQLVLTADSNLGNLTQFYGHTVSIRPLSKFGFGFVNANEMKVWIRVGILRRELNSHAAKFLELATNTRYPVFSQIGRGHLLRASRATSTRRPPRTSVRVCRHVLSRAASIAKILSSNSAATWAAFLTVTQCGHL